MTKANQVREMIAQAKAKQLDAASLIKPVMEKFGFHRQLARAYINNNWDKVAAAVIEPEVISKPAKTLSMSKDAIRKREARARAKAAAVAAAVAE